MKIKIENLGVLKRAEFELGEFTILCGGNNSGKTYATYALFGFLFLWRETFALKVSKQIIDELLTEGSTKINIQDYLKETTNILRESCNEFVTRLPMVFASSETNFSNASFLVTIDEDELQPISTFEREIGTAKTPLFSIFKQKDQFEVTISLLKEKHQAKMPIQIIQKTIGFALKDIIFEQLFPKPFIASAERTGAAIFRNELDFARNRLVEQLGDTDKDINPFELIKKFYSNYPLPVKENVDFTRQLEDLTKRASFIEKEHPQLLNDFTDIIGGSYKVIKDDNLYFIPDADKRVKLTMAESSSGVRSMLDIGFYLRHVAQRGDLLMVDEPELNLHPENQRRIARLFAQLVNIGIKVFITTHSDYIIKELNTLIMLSNETSLSQQICEDEGYKPGEVIAADKIRVYIAEKKLMQIEGKSRRTRHYTLTPADIDPELGIEARSFDTTIDEMNRIQEALYFAQEADE